MRLTKTDLLAQARQSLAAVRSKAEPWTEGNGASMKTCPKCGQPTSLWSRDLSSGVCRQCQQAEAKQRAEEAKLRAEVAKRAAEYQQETRESILIGDRKIACPICGHDRFSKQETLMNTRAAAVLNMSWMNSGAETCTCQRCGYILWFRK